MNTRKFAYLLLCLSIISVRILPAQRPAALDVFLKKESVSHALVGLKVVDLTNGKTMVSYQSNASLTPASTLKIVTTATALEVLNEDFYFETPLLYDGHIQDSALTGNLYIKGVGDPTLGSEHAGIEKEAFLKQWLSAISGAGIKQIYGDLVVLDQLFGYDGISPRWMWEDLGNYYAPGIYGISIFDNMYRIHLQSDKSGTKTNILYTEPPMPDLHFTNEIQVMPSSDSDDVYISGYPFSNERRLYGNIPTGKTSLIAKGDIPDPGLYMARYFYAYLQGHGIQISGKATTYRLDPQWPATENEIGKIRSGNLASIVKVINVRSNNHYTEHLYKYLTLLKDIHIPDYWKEKGLDADALFMYDGSGVSPINAVSADFLTDILVFMYNKNGKSGAFYQSLPVAGKEGTVASFLKNTALAGKAHLKSGAITKVQAYAGYIEQGNKRYALAVIVNNFTGKRAELRKDLEQLLVELF